jgi:hypothetical protein
MKVRKFLQGLIGLLVLLGLSQSASAQKAIRQTKTLPIVISKPGSYILKSNITVPDANTTAILVQADNVTIDLNGFSILGPCTGGPPCSPTGSGNGIDNFSSGNSNLTVLNGTISGMGADGILINGDGRVQGVRVVGNGFRGMTIPAMVTNSMAESNGGDGIQGRQLIGNFAAGNAGHGLTIFSLGGYADNVMFANTAGSVSGGTNMGHNLCNGSLCP